MGSKRLKIGEELVTDIPSNWRRKNIKDMDFSCISAPNLYTNEEQMCQTFYVPKK